MDYIIFGIGTSATLVLVGWLLRDWGPKLRDRTPAEDEVLGASELVTRMAWARFCAACGMALVFCGVLIMLVTIVAALLSPSDRVALIAVVSAFGVGALLMLVWTWLYQRQFGSIGVLRPTEEPPAPAAAGDDVPVAPVREPAPDVRPAPSFADAVASRGGLGRFAAFFRRGPGDAAESAQHTGDAVAATPSLEQPSQASADSSTPQAGLSPTDAVIAELDGEPEDSQDKRLSEDDPLVTAVRGVLSDAREDQAGIEPSLASGIPVSNAASADSGVRESTTETDDSRTQPDQRTIDAPDANHSIPVEESSAEAPGEDRSGHEVALEDLRRRRLARLAREQDPE